MKFGFPVNNLQSDSIILIDKPLQWSSFQTLKKVRYLLNGSKTGHAGTLDPLASGLLILCTGKATKQVDRIQALQKEYTGSFLLGYVTDSYDLETVPQLTLPEAEINFSRETLQETANTFLGEINQMPPVFSAIKIQGKRAYNLARKGITPELKSRLVQIYGFEITEVRGSEVFFKITCSKGTYIRSLANDFGKVLKTGAYLKSLRRTKTGDFNIKDALTIEKIEELLKNQ
jgi:tRNA pseudouridine55 synthase